MLPAPTATASRQGTADVELAAFCKAIAHPARVQILRRLAKSPCICGEIVQGVGLAQSTVSAHLRVLRSAGLVKGEVDGPRVCYCINPEAMQRWQQLAAGLVGELEASDRTCCELGTGS